MKKLSEYQINNIKKSCKWLMDYYTIKNDREGFYKAKELYIEVCKNG